MKNKHPKNKDSEQIDIDNRDVIVNNTTLNNSILKLINISEPVLNRYGHELDHFCRFIWICNLASYITEEVLLNRVIEFLKSQFASKTIFGQTEDYLKSLDRTLYSPEDFIKFKAIYFSIRAKYIAIMETFNSKNSSMPTFEIKLENRIISHNFPLVERSIFRNFEIEYKENLKKLPPTKALEILRNRMETLRDIDFLYDTAVFSKIIKYHQNTKEILVDETNRTKPVTTQQNGSNKKEGINSHPDFDPNLWNHDCFELFKYLYDCYYRNTIRQLTNIWFYLKEYKNNKYVLKATKDKYIEFVLEKYGKSIKNFDKAHQKWEDKEWQTIDDHRKNFEDGLKEIAKHAKNT